MNTLPENKVEAKRLLDIAENFLMKRDLKTSKEFAILAQETEPLLDGSDQIIAIVDVLLSSEKCINNHYDWYAILQIDCQENKELEVIKKQYRKLALLLHPDKNKYPFADQAFTLVANAWSVLANSAKKTLFDKEILLTKVDLSSVGKLPIKQVMMRKKKVAASSSSISNFERLSTFWTACPYCLHLHEYPRVYEGCCLRCDNCKRAFEAVILHLVPPIVLGKDAYYCCWGIFPMGYVMQRGDGDKAHKDVRSGFPQWMQPYFGSAQGIDRVDDAYADTTVPSSFPSQQHENFMGGGSDAGVTMVDAVHREQISTREVGHPIPYPAPAFASRPKKRGRPRKYP